MAKDWNEIRQKLLIFPKLYTQHKQLLELVDICAKSTILTQLIPTLSLSRLCICRYVGDTHGPCLYYKNGKFIVATFNSQEEHLFDDIDKLLHFVEASLLIDNQ